MKKAVLVLCTLVIVFPLLSQTQSKLYEQVSASTVYLKHEIFLDPSFCRNEALFRRWEDFSKRKILSTYTTLASGTGFLVGDGTIILTNRHVVDLGDISAERSAMANSASRALEESAGKSFKPEEIKALKIDLYSMLTKGRYRFSATLGSKVAADPDRLAVGAKGDPDLAVLRLGTSMGRGLSLAPASLLDSKLVGQEVFSFGFPLGATMGGTFSDIVVTMNKGSISALRKAELGIQHSAAISHGNSGGPLVDATGLVLGMNTGVIEEGNSLYFAIGADRIRDFLAQRNVVLPEVKSEVAAEKPSAAVLPPAIQTPPAQAPATPPVQAKATEQAPAPAEPARIGGLLANAQGEAEVSANVYVDSEKDAVITLNGKKLGTAPRLIALSESLSTILVQGKSGQFTARLRLNPGIRGTTVLKAELLRPGDLVISANEDVTKVLMDGQDMGAFGSGLFKGLSAGEHRVEVLGAGLYFSQKVTIVADTMVALNAKLAPVGRLVLKLPQDAQASVSGPDYATSAKGSLDLANVPAGDYSLRAEGGEYLTVSATLKVERGGTTTWEPYSTGSLGFAIAQKGVLCFLGKAEGLGTDKDAEGLAPGSYTATLRKSGYKDLEVSVTITAGKRSLITASLTELGRASILLPKLGSPVTLLVDGQTIIGKDGPDGSVLYEGVPAGYGISITFASAAANSKALDIPAKKLSLKEGETLKLDLPSGRIALPWLPKDATVEIGGDSKIVLENQARAGFLSPPLPPGSYSLQVLSESFGQGIFVAVTVKEGGSSEPEEYAQAVSERLAASRESLAKDLAAIKSKKTLGFASLGTGALGTVGAVVLYVLGSQAMADYRAATDTATATERWKTVSLYQSLFVASAGVGGVGLGLSPIFLLKKGPDPAALQRSIQALDEGIKALGK